MGSQRPDQNDRYALDRGLIQGVASDADRITVAGIGASAGGLKALKAFFEALPESLGIAFAVVVHLDPDYESNLAEILARCTDMPVTMVTGTVKLLRDHVYIIPPDRQLVAAVDSLSVQPFSEPRGSRKPIDSFFRSLAETHDEGFTVILSGGGTDGSLGIKAAKESNSLVLVQDPQEAEYDGMPRSAIDTGLVDLVLPVREIAQRLTDFTRNKGRIGKLTGMYDDSEATLLHQILSQVRLITGHDFSQYKMPTLLRRVGRRLTVHRLDSLNAYLDFLKSQPVEAWALLKDLLIGVTTFFRDREAFDALKVHVVPHLFEEKRTSDQVRVWVPACATGEEAYSIAMLLVEHLSHVKDPPAIQVYATDLDEDALALAREGCYPTAIEADVSEERLARFFTREKDQYRVIKELRDLVIFAPHSILRDPPFSRMDLISCRNLLIYLQREVQLQVFQIFHYALRPGGYLFLGSAETVQDRTDLFRPVEKKHRLFHSKKKAGATTELPFQQLWPQRPINVPEPRRLRLERTDSAVNQHRELLEEFAPPSILVDENYTVLHFSETVGSFHLHPGGLPTSDVTKLVRPELQRELSSALYSVFSKNEPYLSMQIAVPVNGSSRPVYLAVRPKTLQSGGERVALVSFLEGNETNLERRQQSAAQLPDADTIQRLENEVAHLREQLRNSSEEYETSAEEYKATNEELQSVNEEYRAAMEELETSKEELQSVNEELQTLNAELKTKLDEISKAHNDLENLIGSTQIGTLFLDRELRIRWYTRSMERLFHLMPSDRGRPISHLRTTLLYEDLEADTREVFNRLEPIQREVRTIDGLWYLVYVLPYRTQENEINGVVVTFVDITRRKEAEDRLLEMNENLETRVAERTRQVHQLASALTLAERKEQRRISQILHDDLQQYLYGMRLQLSLLRTNIDGKIQSGVSKQISDIVSLVNRTISITRALTIDLSPPVLKGEGLSESLGWLKSHMSELHNLNVEVEASNTFFIEDADMRILVFQIIRELLLNVVKHAGTQHARIVLSQKESNLIIDVTDDGVGFDPNEIADRGENGFGLYSVRERLELFGGGLTIDSALGSGTHITAIVPIEREPG